MTSSDQFALQNYALMLLMGAEGYTSAGFKQLCKEMGIPIETT